MDFFDKMKKTVSDTVKSATDKNHKMAKINRLRNRIALAQEEKEKAYIMLGKYFYANNKAFPDENTADYFMKIEIAENDIAFAANEIEKTLNFSEKGEEFLQSSEKSDEKISPPLEKSEEEFSQSFEKSEEIPLDEKDEKDEKEKKENEEYATENDENIPW